MLIVLALAGHRDRLAGIAVKTLAMISLGLLLGTVGMDKLTGFPRFTFGSLGLSDGRHFAALAIGLFGISEILLQSRADRHHQGDRATIP